jgi:hypothetical protein
VQKHRILCFCAKPDPIVAHIQVSVIIINMCAMERRFSFLNLETDMEAHNSCFGLRMWKRMTWFYSVLSTTASSKMVVDNEREKVFVV